MRRGIISSILGGSPSHALHTKSSHPRPRRRWRQAHKDEGAERPEGGSVGRFQLHKSRGQHLLTNPRVLDSIVRRAQVRPTDTVLEIGPGTGNLTIRLLQAARHVVAVEIDGRMVDALRGRVSQLGLDDRLTVITDNALKTEFPPFNLCVANIPYGISSPLIAKLLFHSRQPSFRSATLLLQKEFARRLLAVPGDPDFNRLAVNVGLVASVECLMDVSKKNFVPCPRVDSSLINIKPRDDIPMVDLDEWLGFTRACFSKKNKTLGSIFKQKKKIAELFGRSQTRLRAREYEEYADQEDGDEDDDVVDDQSEEEEGGSGLEVSAFKEKVVGILKAGGFDGKRPSKLSNQELLHLLDLFNREGILFR